MAEESMMGKMLAAKQRFIPKRGFNVVGVDTFEMPGEELYLIAHYDSEEEANASQQAYQQAHPDVPVYVYGPEGEEGATPEQPVQKAMDFVHPIVEKDREAYENIKRILIRRHGYQAADFDEGGEFYGWSTNELVNLLKEELRGE